MSDASTELKACSRCGGKRTVQDIKAGVDPLTVYPEQMPCPDCTDGTWASARSTPEIGEDVLVERLRFCGHRSPLYNEAADRLILYREALEDARNNILSLLGGFRDDMPDAAVKLFQAQAKQIDTALGCT